jgi:Rho termination factor, N-terminal domain
MAERTQTRRRDASAGKNQGKNQPGNQTPNTPGLSETDLRAKKVDELRQLARSEGVTGVSSMRKDELIKAISKAYRAAAKKSTRAAPDDGARKSAAAKGAGSRGGAKKSTAADKDSAKGGVRRGSKTSKSVQYSQEITSPEEDPERPGRSLVTTSHDVIREWAEARQGVPATVEGTEHGDRLGVLRFDFPPGDSDRLRHVSWDEWFATFDERGLNFIYQEERSDGRPSTFFRLENPEREEA